MKAFFWIVTFICLHVNAVYAQQHNSKDSLVVPAQITQQLDSLLEEWHICEEWQTPRAEQDISERKPSFVKEHFNEDEFDDYVLQVKTKKSGRNAELVVAFVSDGANLIYHELDDIPSLHESCSRHLYVISAGDTDYDYESGEDFVYERNAIMALTPEKGGTSYVWEGSGFKAIASAD